jgi:hypothetical protein
MVGILSIAVCCGTFIPSNSEWKAAATKQSGQAAGGRKESERFVLVQSSRPEDEEAPRS